MEEWEKLHKQESAAMKQSQGSHRAKFKDHSVEWLKYLLRIVPLAQEMMRSIGFLLG